MIYTAPNAVIESPGSDPATIDWRATSLLRIALERRRVVGGTAAIGLLLAILLLVLVPRHYESHFGFVPQAGQGGASGNLASLAGQFGVSLDPGGSPLQSPALYTEVVRSRDLLLPVVRDSFSLERGGARQPLPVLLGFTDGTRDENEAKTIDWLQRKSVSASVATRTSGMVTVAVDTKHAELSRQLAERLLRGLQESAQSLRHVQAAQDRQFLEGRLTDARAALRNAEDAMQYFLLRNRGYTQDPEMAFRYTRLQREIELKTQVVAGISQQYEETRIREQRDTPQIVVIEAPALAALPKPSLLPVIAFALVIGGALAGVFAAVALHTIEHAGLAVPGLPRWIARTPV